jgi:chromosome segregation protein
LLKLRKVELQGFKSFCDRTELRFNGGGIAAVVGPNGCGKSNLSDAISWVLGEQSARSLRGARMEDVIFAGTKSRKPVGMASVTMVLVDPLANSISPAPPEILDGVEIPANVHEIHAANGHSVVHHPGAKPGEITITRRLFRSGESEYLIDGRQARLRDIQDIFMGSGLCRSLRRRARALCLLGRVAHRNTSCLREASIPMSHSPDDLRRAS